MIFLTYTKKVLVLETASCGKNRVRLRTIHQMVGPLPGPCVCGSFSAPGCPFIQEKVLIEKSNINFAYYNCVGF